MVEKSSINSDEDEDERAEDAKDHKCEECPAGLPLWMATFSDMVTLLLTFFVLLLSFAKTETAKYESALGSIRNAFGGNIFKKGEVLQLGKSPDNRPTMLEAQSPIQPFPIDFLTVKGFLDKHEVNRESSEDLNEMREDLLDFDLADHSDIYEMPEGVKVHLRDKIFFKKGSAETINFKEKVFKDLIKIMRVGKWELFVQGHSSAGEKSQDGQLDAFGLSALRAQEISKALVERGVPPEKISSVFYGDTRPDKSGGNDDGVSSHLNRRVDFILRKVDLNRRGNRVESRGP